MSEHPLSYLNDHTYEKFVQPVKYHLHYVYCDLRILFDEPIFIEMEYDIPRVNKLFDEWCAETTDVNELLILDRFRQYAITCLLSSEHMMP